MSPSTSLAPPLPAAAPIPGFLLSLYEILGDERLSDVITWTQGGGSFVVLDKTRFSEEVMPNFFKSSKWDSFVRQLNMYDFQKQGESKVWEYSHRHFTCGRPDDLQLVTRKPKSAKKRKAIEIEEITSQLRQACDVITAQQSSIDQQQAQISSLQSELTTLRALLMNQVPKSDVTTAVPIFNDFLLDGLSYPASPRPSKRARLTQDLPVDMFPASSSYDDDVSEIVEVESLASSAKSSPVTGLSMSHSVHDDISESVGPTTMDPDQYFDFTTHAHDDHVKLDNTQPPTHKPETHTGSSEPKWSAPRSTGAVPASAMRLTKLPLPVSHCMPFSTSGNRGFDTEEVVSSYCRKALLLLSM